MAKAAITIVTWNSMKHLPETLASVFAQTHEDRTVLIVDNASSDGTIGFVRERYPQAVILRNSKNLGFARAHNQGITYARTHLAVPGEELYVMVTNPDLILDPGYLETLIRALESRLDAGSAGGKLLRAFIKGEGELREPVLSGTFDSTGMRLARSRRTVERGAGEHDDGSVFGRTEEVFGVTGAAALYRLRALQDVAYRDEYFDEDFFAYKEDVDLAWRLRLRGWEALYVPAARAYHYRTAYGADRSSFRETVRNRRHRSGLVRRLSYRNHLLMLLKNEHLINLLLHLPLILWYELRKLVYLAVFEPRTLVAWGELFRLLPRMIAKRRLAMARAEVDARSIRRWFG
ncbi:hypothetical protein AMJ57_04365 [Parcubacteria bacterium SG8_24]|nr:MAG: hypothetical protein AMJ57_04365 [Parcubacteria bacterium SG8_24]